MAFKNKVPINFLSFPSYKISFVLLLSALIWEVCICIKPGAGQTSLINAGEISEEIGNQPEEKNIPSFNSPESHNDEDLLMYKRHMGSIAALSGSKPMSGSRFIILPSKKHIGSIAAAQSMGRGVGRNLEMYKRHLGSLMALSGQKPKPLTRSLKESPAYSMDASTNKLDMKTPPMNYDFGNEMGIPIRYISEFQENEATPQYLMANENDPAPLNGFHDVNLQKLEPERAYRNLPTADLNDDDEVSYKSKRFLGPLARGGWFPRQFRGIVSENSFGKRHIGSLARLGWMPHAKGNSRLGLIMERGEIGLKRNDMSPRSRMLYHFSAPSLWTSPRGK